MDKTMAKTALLASLTLALLAPFIMPGPTALAQEDLLEELARSYDLLEAGKLKEAKELYGKILTRRPGNPLALNNLAYIQIKEGDLTGALDSLEQALVQARGYRIKVNKVCAVDGICLAFRPGGPAYGDQDLEPLVRLNLMLLQHRLAPRQSGS
jgi:tetratricopeptide (TPR) repeat protein